MINKSQQEKYDASHKIVLYETTKKGECIPKTVPPKFASEMVDEFYEDLSKEWQKLKIELLQGEISPVKFYFEYFHMNFKDMASRVRLSPGKVKKHFTMAGFLKINIETLKRYALIFDISISDFFQFITLKDKIKIDIKSYNDRLTQDIVIKK